MQQKHVEPNILGHMPYAPYVCQAAGASIIGTPPWITERHNYYEATDCRHAVGAKRVENGVNAIQKWVPFTPKCSKKHWRLGLRPRPSNSEGERFWHLPAWQAELRMVLTLFKNGFHSHQNALKSVGGRGFIPDPQIVRESAIDACQSGTPRGRQFPYSPRAPETLGTPQQCFIQTPWLWGEFKI